MSASQIGAYQATAYAFNDRANSGTEVARQRATQEAPEFKASLNGLQTRVGADETGGTDRNKGSKPHNDSKFSGRGKFVDILA